MSAAFTRLAGRLGESARLERDVARDRATLETIAKQRTQQEQFSAQFQQKERALDLQRAGLAIRQHAQTPTARKDRKSVLEGLQDRPGLLAGLSPEQRRAAELFDAGAISKSQLGQQLLPGQSGQLGADSQAVQLIIESLPPEAQRFAPALQALPEDGIYATWTTVDGQRYGSATSIGIKPTFHDEAPRVVEVFLFDFDRDLYGKHMRVEFVQRLRGQEKFDSVDALVEQITRDVEESRSILHDDQKGT